ncbi:MAG: LysR family transcriptional regulator [Pseudomonadota bacterium]
MVRLEQLRVLRAVVEAGSIQAAAEAVHKTQPAISQALKALETETETALFDRSGYRLELTALGERFYKQSLRVLAETEGLNEIVTHFGEGNEERVTVALDATLNLGCAVQPFQMLQERFPETNLVLRTEVLSGAVTAVRSDVADMAIGPAGPVFLEEEKFDYVPVGTSTLVTVAAPAMLAQAGTDARATDLRPLQQILVSDSGDAKGLYDREFGVQDGQRRWYVSDIQTKKHLIEAGLGWGRMPHHLVADGLARGLLVELEFAETLLPVPVTYYAFKRANRLLGPVATALWEVLSEGPPRGSDANCD